MKEDHIQYVISLPEITDEFPSLLELTVVDREKVQALKKARKEAAEGNQNSVTLSV